MTQQKLIMIIFLLLISTSWAMNIWGGWAEKIYKNTKDRNLCWYWLRLLHIEHTERNYILFIKGISAFGVLLVSIGTLLAI